jgi:hypothetical protein
MGDNIAQINIKRQHFQRAEICVFSGFCDITYLAIRPRALEARRFA